MSATPLRYIPKPGPRRIATINGRPAWQVVQERRDAAAMVNRDPAALEAFRGMGRG